MTQALDQRVGILLQEIGTLGQKGGSSKQSTPSEFREEKLQQDYSIARSMNPEQKLEMSMVDGQSHPRGAAGIQPQTPPPTSGWIPQTPV